MVLLVSDLNFYIILAAIIVSLSVFSRPCLSFFSSPLVFFLVKVQKFVKS